MTAGGLKGSFYEGMPDSMKPKIKEKRPLDNITFGKNTRSKGERHHSQCEKGCNCDVEISPTLPLPHTVRSGDGRTLRAMGSAGSFVAAWLLEPTVNSTCVLALKAFSRVRGSSPQLPHETQAATRELRANCSPLPRAHHGERRPQRRPLPFI